MYKLTIDQLYPIWIAGLLEGADDDEEFDYYICQELFTHSIESIVPKPVIDAWLKEKRNES